MDKNLEEVSTSDGSAEEFDEDQEIAHAIFLADQLAAEKQRLQASVETLHQELALNRERMEYLKDASMQSKLSELQADSPVSERSAISQSQNLSEDRSEDSSDSIFSLKLGELESVASELVNALKKQSAVMSNIRECFEAPASIRNEDFLSENTPPQTPEDGAKADGSHAASDINPEIIEAIVGSGGKGKESANPNFRYKKRLKTEAASQDSPADESAAKSSAAPSVPLQSKSPKPGRSDMNPGEEHSEEHLQKLAKSCARTSGSTKRSGSPSGDNVGPPVPKKVKIQESKKPSSQCLSLDSMLSNKNYESLELVSFMDAEQASEFYKSDDESTPAS